MRPRLRGNVEEPVRATLADACHVGDGDRQEVEHVGDRCAVEVPVRLHATVEGDDGIVHGTGEFAPGDSPGMFDGVARGARYLRGTSDRVRILHQ